ncbi:hypothetical protein Tco_1439799 [Tanacetum coccineum]
MDKGFLNRKSTGKKDVDNGLMKKGSLLGDLAGKIKNIDGKILGKNGKPVVARRCIRSSGVTKESVSDEVRMEDINSRFVENATHTVEQPITSDHQKCMVQEVVNHPNLGSKITMVTVPSNHTNVALIEQNISSVVTLPKDAINEINARFIHTLYGFPVGKRLAFPMFESQTGRNEYARALVEVSAEKPLVDSVDIDNPLEDRKGHTTVNIRIEYEWQPPRCGTCKIFDHLESVCPKKLMDCHVKKKSDMQAAMEKDKQPVQTTCKKDKGKQSSDSTKKPSPSDSSKNGESAYINDDIKLDKLRNFVNKTIEEESVLEYIRNNDIDGCNSREKQDEKVSVKKPSSSMDVINEDFDTDEDEIFLPNDGISLPGLSVGGGQLLEEEMLNAYDDYEDQFEEYPSSYQDFCDHFDFKVKGRGRK